MKKAQTEPRRGGFYWIGNKPYVAVTHVLRVIDKPSLRYWFGKEVYLAMVKDPTLSEGEALGAPYKTSDKAKRRGKTIHSIVETYKKSGIILKDIPKEFANYAKAFYSWIEDNHIRVLAQEKTIVSEKHKYAGTLDLLVEVNKTKKNWVVDVKTGAGIYPEAFLQLSAYKEALEEQGTPVDEIAVLLLLENGKYQFEKGLPELDAFLAAKKLWEWQNKGLIAKVGYEGG